MTDQDSRTSCSVSNSCTPSINIDTYTVSLESLPNFHDVSGEMFKYDNKSRNIFRSKPNRLNTINENDSNLMDETFSASFNNKISQLNLRAQNYTNRSQNINKLKELSKFENELVRERKNIDNPREIAISGEGKNCDDDICKGYNASIKIKLILNSERLKKLTRISNASGENCSLEIELNGNKNRKLKLTNHNKKNQANSVIYKESTSTNKIHVIGCKEANSARCYSTSISKTIKRQNAIKKSNIGNKPLFLTQYETFESRVIPEVLSSSLPNTLITERSEYKERKTYSWPLSTKSISGCCDSRLTKQSVLKNKIIHSKTESLMQDKFVQTILPKVKENTDLTEDEDLLKLGMWLEILNNSEYNIYNQDFCITTKNERTKFAETRDIENERNFNSFLEEMGLYETHNKGERIKSSNSNISYSENCTIRPNNYDYAHLLEHFRNLQSKSLVIKNDENCPKDPSMESIRLTDLNPNEERDGKEKRNNFYTNVVRKHFSSSSESSFKKIFQNVFTRLVPKASTEGKTDSYKTEEQRFLAFLSLSERNLPNLWTKINPFKYCFIKNRDKPFSKILEERKKSLNEIWNSNSDTFQYSSLPTNDNNDFNYLKAPKYDSLNNFYNNNYFSGSQQYYLNNNPPSKNSSPNYPYDTIPFMQCPGGCDLCNPDSNKVQNLNMIPH